MRVVEGILFVVCEMFVASGGCNVFGFDSDSLSMSWWSDVSKVDGDDVEADDNGDGEGGVERMTLLYVNWFWL